MIVDLSATHTICIDTTIKSEWIGAVIDDRYRILRRLGEGGMGTVFVAEHLTLKKKVALKIIAARLWGAADMIERFQREAQVASLIAHDNVVSVFDLGVLASGSAYYAMELLDGEDMAVTLQRDGRLPWPRVRRIVRQLCGALAGAHARGILHRDIKPSNIFRVSGRADPDFVKLLDFGLVKVLGDTRLRGVELTGDGNFIGTLKYAAPEQLMGEDVDPRIDIFSLGATMYRLLTDRHPYSGDNITQLLLAMHRRQSIPLRQWIPDSQLPEQVQELVDWMMEPDRNRRLPTVDDLARVLDEIPEVSRTDDPSDSGDLIVQPAPHPQRRLLPDGRALFVHTTVIGTRVDRQIHSALSHVARLLPAALVLTHLGNSVRLTCEPTTGDRIALYTDASRRETRCEHITLMDSTSPGSFDLGHRRSAVRRIAYAIGRREARALVARLGEHHLQVHAAPELALLAVLTACDDDGTQHLECICARP